MILKLQNNKSRRHRVSSVLDQQYKNMRKKTHKNLHNICEFLLLFFELEVKNFNNIPFIIFKLQFYLQACLRLKIQAPRSFN